MGEDRLAVRSREVVGRDPNYGNDITADVDTLVRWCSVTPTRSSESTDRSAPAIAGATVLAPVKAATIEQADAIVWPITGQKEVDGRVVYEGRVWEVSGEVGDWQTYTEVQIRRQS